MLCMSLYRLLFASRVTILIYILTLSHFITCLFSLIDLDPIFKNHLFMAVLGLLLLLLWAFLGYSLVVKHGLLAVTSLFVEHRLW